MPDIHLAAFECETQRLQLRLLNAGDEALFCDLYADPATMRFVGEPLSPRHAKRSFRRTLELMQQQPPAWLMLVIIDKAARRPIGVCGIPHLGCDAGRVEAGMLLIPDGRGRGFGSEALKALIDRIFAVLAADEVWVEFSSEDPAVLRLTARLGFAPRADKTCAKVSSSKCIGSVHRRAWCQSA